MQCWGSGGQMPEPQVRAFVPFRAFVGPFPCPPCLLYDTQHNRFPSIFENNERFVNYLFGEDSPPCPAPNALRTRSRGLRIGRPVESGTDQPLRGDAFVNPG